VEEELKRALFVLGLVALSACSKTVYTTETLPPLPSTEVLPTTFAPATEPLSVFSNSEIQALILLDQIYDKPIFVDDSEIIAAMNETCEALRDGMTLEQLSVISVEATDGDVDAMEFLAAISAAAVNTICVDQAWKFGI
jgi:hypothetical protein